MFPFFAFIMFDLYHVYIPMYIYIYFFFGGAGSYTLRIRVP